MRRATVHREEVVHVRLYEMMVIINPSVEEHSAEIKGIEELVARLSGEVTKLSLIHI